MSSSLKRSDVTLSNRNKSGFFASVSNLLGLNARAQRRRSQNTQHRNLTRQNNLDLTEDNVHLYRCLHGSQSQYQDFENDSNIANYGEARPSKEGKMGFADSDSLESVKDLSNKASNLSSGNKFSTFFRKQKKTPEFADVVDSAMAQEKMTKTKSTGNIMFKKKTKRNKSSQPNTTSELESTNDTDSNLTLKMTKTKSTGNILASFRKRMNSVKRSRSSSNRRLDVNINNSKQDQLSSYYISDFQSNDKDEEREEEKEEAACIPPESYINPDSTIAHKNSQIEISHKTAKSSDIPTSTISVDYQNMTSADEKPSTINNENQNQPNQGNQGESRADSNKAASSTNQLKNMSSIEVLGEESDKLPEMTSINPPVKPVFYELKVNLKKGTNLAIRDISGTSDPYVKFVLNGNTVHKSKIIFKNLNPVWNEEFSIKLSQASFSQSNTKLNQLQSTSNSDNLMSSLVNESNSLEYILSKYKLKMFVYDYDRGFLNDDLIGYAMIDLNCVKNNPFESVNLELEDKSLSKNEYLGNISLDLNLVPRFKADEAEQISAHSSSKIHATTTMQTNKRQCVLNVILIEGKDLLAMDDNGLSDPYVKFKLEKESYRSRTIRKTLNPEFKEHFQMYIFDMSSIQLQISVHDFDDNKRNDFMGRANVDLNNYELDKTHFVKIPIEPNAGTISILFSITGLYNTTTTPIEYTIPYEFRDEVAMRYGYTFKNSISQIENVGWLRVKVIRAEGLASADINGKSDPFCSLTLINQMVQTHTLYKTLNPEWNQTFEFLITDIHAILEVSVLDEDKNKVFEFLGKVAIPLLKVQNGKRKLYALKDKKLAQRTKGSIELEIDVIYNPVKAIIKTVNPRDEKYIIPETKFKVQVLSKNIARCKNMAQGVIDTANYIQNLFKWEKPWDSFVGLIVFIVIVLFTQIYMLPLFLLLIFLKNYIIIRLKSYSEEEDDASFEEYDDDEDLMTEKNEVNTCKLKKTDSKDTKPKMQQKNENKKPKKDQKKGIKNRLTEIQEICLKIQNTTDEVASLGERVINTFNFTTPWLSWLAITVFMVASLILYLFPLRYIILIWGINKFTKKFRKPPGYIDNTEVLDFLSRVPSKSDLYHYKELKYLRSSASVQSHSYQSSRSQSLSSNLNNAKDRRLKHTKSKLN